jgi:hypothetical protein
MVRCDWCPLIKPLSLTDPRRLSPLVPDDPEGLYSRRMMCSKRQSSPRAVVARSPSPGSRVFIQPPPPPLPPSPVPRLPSRACSYGMRTMGPWALITDAAHARAGTSDTDTAPEVAHR